MNETVVCPDCHAQLLMPALPAGQTVQCPRCQRVFEPVRSRSHAAPTRATQTRQGDVESEDHADLRRLGNIEPLTREWKAYVAIALLALSVLSYAVQVYVYFELELVVVERELARLREFQAGGGFRVGRRMEDVNAARADVEIRLESWERFSEHALVFHHLTYWPTVVLFLIWLHQASRNLRKLQVDGLSHTPAQAIVSFFIPGMNLFVPYIVMQQIWRASHPRAVETPLSWLETPHALSVRFWWFFFLAAGILATIASFIMPAHWLNGFHGGDETVFAARINCVAYTAAVIAGLLLIFIIHRITKRQKQRYVRLYEVAT